MAKVIIEGDAAILAKIVKIFKKRITATDEQGNPFTVKQNVADPEDGEGAEEETQKTKRKRK